MENIEITNHGDALTVAFILAVTAPSDEQSRKFTKLSESLSIGMSKKQVEICKMAAEVAIKYQNKQKETLNRSLKDLFKITESAQKAYDHQQPPTNEAS